ncbi:hypothetical protein ACWFR5_16630 [Streptomyces sp. NPDC055092]
MEANANSSQERVSDAEMSVTVVAAEWPDFAAHPPGQITLRLASGVTAVLVALTVCARGTASIRQVTQRSPLADLLREREHLYPEPDQHGYTLMA